MKKLKYAAALCALLIAATSLHAQENKLSGGLIYNYSLPMGSFKNDIISNGSPRGVNLELMYHINPKWAAGLSFGYQDYYQKYPRAVYNLDKTQQVSAVLSNSLQAVPVMFTGSFTPVTTGFLQPYISLGAGGYFTNYNQYLGQYNSSSLNKANFIAQGGAGVFVPLNHSGTTKFQLGAAYNYVPYKNDGYSSLNSLNIQAGIHMLLK